MPSSTQIFLTRPLPIWLEQKANVPRFSLQRHCEWSLRNAILTGLDLTMSVVT